MANTKSALKAIRQNARRRSRNRIVRGKARTAVKRAARAIDSGSPTAAAELRAAQSQLDKAAQKGVIHPNAAARHKSRLARRARAKST